MQIMEIASRLELWQFIKCGAYLNNIAIDEHLKHDLLHGTDAELKARLSELSYKLNISEKAFQQVLHGDMKPLTDLLTDSSLMVMNRKDLLSFIHILMFTHSVSEPSFYKYIQMNKRDFITMIKHGRLVSNRTLKLLSEVFAVSPSLIRHAFSQVGIRVVMPIGRHHDKNVQNRSYLKGYLKCLCYINGSSLTKLANEMNFSTNSLLDSIAHKPKDELINDLREVPFILHVPLKNFNAILDGDQSPRKELLHKLGTSITERRGLRRYVYALGYLFNMSIKAISDNMHHSANYISTTLNNGTGEALSDMFNQIAKVLHISNEEFTIVLARANVSSAYHAYLARMYFTLRYLHSPIDYYESDRMHKRDRDYIAEGYRNVRKIVSHKTDLDLEDNLWTILLSWGHMFGFSAKSFIQDNFKQFTQHKVTYLWQGGKYHAIMNKHDWLIILQKLHHQLKAIKYAFNLTDVQKSVYAPYVYVKGINLKDPVDTDAQVDLARLGKGRHLFHARFDVTGVKSVNNSPYPDKKLFSPVLSFYNIKHDGKLVASHVRFNYTQGFCKLGQLQQGDLVSFTARVKPYYKGTITKNTVKTLDYTLNYPGQIKIVRRIHQRTQAPVPKEKASLVAYAIEHNHTKGYDFSLENYKYIRYCKIHYRKWKQSLKKTD